MRPGDYNGWPLELCELRPAVGDQIISDPDVLRERGGHAPWEHPATVTLVDDAHVCFALRADSPEGHLRLSSTHDGLILRWLGRERDGYALELVNTQDAWPFGERRTWKLIYFDATWINGFLQRWRTPPAGRVQTAQPNDAYGAARQALQATRLSDDEIDAVLRHRLAQRLAAPAGACAVGVRLYADRPSGYPDEDPAPGLTRWVLSAGYAFDMHYEPGDMATWRASRDLPETTAPEAFRRWWNETMGGV